MLVYSYGLRLNTESVHGEEFGYGPHINTIVPHFPDNMICPQKHWIHKKTKLDDFVIA